MKLKPKQFINKKVDEIPTSNQDQSQLAKKIEALEYAIVQLKANQNSSVGINNNTKIDQDLDDSAKSPEIEDEEIQNLQ